MINEHEPNMNSNRLNSFSEYVWKSERYSVYYDMNQVTTICAGCSQSFKCDIRKYNHNNKVEQKLFCSRECYNKHKYDEFKIKVNCANCGNEILKLQSHLKRSKTGNLYCNKSCAAANNNKLFKKWENHPSFKSGISGYRSMKLRTTPEAKCVRCGFINPLALEVHHKDRNRHNNKEENLEILCANCHTIEHRSRVVV